MVFLIVLLFSIAAGFHYEAGYDHHYTYSSTSDTIGMHNITTVLKFRIRKINETENGVRFHQLMVDSFVQHSQNGQYADNPFQWNFSKRFVFEMEPDGLVNFVHYDEEDEGELVILKKALVGTLSVKFLKSDKSKWKYTSTEQDHGGHLTHTYEGVKTQSGIRLTRHHHSAENVFRTHSKEIHFDHTGNVRKILATDNITMKGDIPAPRGILGTPLPVHRDIKVFSSGEFPGISATAKTEVHLTLKRKISSPESHEVIGLVRDSIIVKPKPVEKRTWKESEETVTRLMKCVLSHDNKFAPNRTVCVRNLTKEVLNLKEEDFLLFSQKSFKKICADSDLKCLEERYLVLDVIAQAKTNVSQQILVDHVLSPNSSVEEVRRSLFHCISVKQPIQSLVQAIEQLCFGKEDLFHGGSNMTVTQKRACLTLGALAKHLGDLGNDTEAQRIVEKFERWLGVHNESEFNAIVKPREKRSVGRGQSYKDRDGHVALKRTLLYTLGNAGHPRSFRHIASYLELNKANAELRRTAAHALRHYKCNESAAHLLRSTLFDSEDIVRHGAYEIYVDHPESKELTKEQENAVLE